MAENRFSKYLDERTSSRYSERLQSAQDRIEWSPIAKVAAAAGLGFLLGKAAMSRPGQKVMARMAKHLPRTADTTDLEHIILQRHYDLHKLNQSVLSQTRMNAALEYFGGHADIRDAMLDIIKGSNKERTLSLFSNAVYEPGRLADMIISNAGKLDMDRTELISGIRKSVMLNQAQRKAAGAQMRFFRERYDDLLVSKYTDRSPLKHATAGDILSKRMKDFKFGQERLFVRGKPVSLQTPFQESVLRGLVRKDKRFENLIVNKGLFKTADGDFIDLRSIWKGVDKAIEASSEFHIPFVGIGPYHLFGLGKYQERRMMPFMHIFRQGENQFIFPLGKGIQNSQVVGNLGLWKLPEDMAYIGGKVYSMTSGKVMAQNIGLAPSQRGQAARIFGQVSGSVGDLAAYQQRRGSREGWRKVLDWLDIGEQESNSILDKLTNLFRKHKNPSWEGNLLSRISEPVDQRDLIDATNRLKKFIHFDSRPVPDHVFNRAFGKDLENLYPGIKFSLDTDEGILSAFETLAVHNKDKISRSFGEEFLTNWNAYSRDPYSFMKNMKTYSNKWPDIGQFGEFFAERDMITKQESIKRLVQQELIEQVRENSGRDFRDIASNLIQTGDINAKGMALDVFMSHASVDDIKNELDNSISIISAGATDYMSNRAPWYSYGPMPLTAEKEIARGTEFFMVRDSVKVTGKDLIAALNGAEKERSAAQDKMLDWARQFTAGRYNMDKFTRTSMFAYHMPFGRIQEALSYLGVGLGPESTSSAASLFGNMITKRYLPALLGVGALGYLSWEFGNITGKTGQQWLADVKEGAREGLASVRDATGITDFFKRSARLTPGSELIWELPGFHFLDPTKSLEEVREEDAGVRPMRKGRWWFLGNCVTPDTLILVNFAESKRAEQVAIGDLLLTHTGELKPVKDVIVRNMRDDEWAPEVQLHTFPIATTTTDNHPYLAVKKKKCPSNTVVDCRPDRQNKMCDKCPYPRFCNERFVWTPKWTMARDLEAGDYLAFPRPKVGTCTEPIYDISSNKEVGYFLGLYLAEGSIKKKVKGKGYSIEIYLNSEESHLANFVAYFVNKYFGCKTRLEQTSDNGIKIIACSRKLVKWIEKVLYCAGKKSPSRILMTKCKDFMLGFIAGMFDGDGHCVVVGNSCQLNITSATLEHLLFVRNVLFSFGIPNSVIKHNTLLDGKEFVGWRLIVDGKGAVDLALQLESYKIDQKIIPQKSNSTHKYIYIDDEYVYIKIREVVDSGYRGIVYDYEVDENHSFCSLSVILHNTPYVGGKIEYYLPSERRMAYADYKMTDVMYGSREEYYRNAWFPTPRYPLAPIRHFITDPYHWERKHYYDRPYPTTGPISEFSDIPVAGATLSAAVGHMLKPPKRMHEEEMRRYAAEVSQEHISTLNQREKDKADRNFAYITPSGDISIVGDIGPARNFQEVARGSEKGLGYRVAGSTGSGRAAVASINEGEFARAYSGKPKSLRERIFVPSRWDTSQQPPSLEGAIQTNSLQYVGAKTYYGLTEMGGIYGFMAQGLTGQPIDSMKVLQDSSRMTSYSRAFWDQNLGGFGGEFSEIGRRFLPRDRRYQQDLDINLIPNTMPSWMPGENYFLDFKRGDPYVKIPRGEARLPGGGYEALWNYHPENMVIRASLAGQDEETIINKLLNIEDAPIFDSAENAMAEGTKIHKAYQRMWQEKGILMSMEELVYDEKARSTGHYDAILNLHGTPTVVDVKTVNQRRWDIMMKEGAFEEHLDQITIYQHALGIKKGGIQYVNRDDLSQTKYIGFDFDNRRYERLVDKLEGIRATIKALIDEGKVSKFELYDPLHRFAILADVAPYSDEYRYYAKYVSQEYSDLTGITGSERQEKEQIKKFIVDTKDRVADMKKKHRFFPYRFKYTDIVREKVHVTEVLDNQTFLTREHPTTPIRMAGITVSSAQGADQTREFINKFIYPGAALTIGVDVNESERRTNDSMGSMAAVVFARGKNLNYAMMRAGLATEKETDWSSAGVHARFSGPEIMLGSLWESFAHADTPFHTKFLHVASPLEEYKRREVFGKSFQSWSIRDQLEPAISGIASKDMFSAAISGGILGGLVYGTSMPRRIKGAKYGALLFAALSGARSLHDVFSDERWIPERRRKEREINEYFDILDYIKYQGMYEYAKRRAEEEGFNVEKLYDELRKKRNITKQLRRDLENEKLQLKLEQLPKKRKATETYKRDIERMRAKRDREIDNIIKDKWSAVKEAEDKWSGIRERTPKWLRKSIDRAQDKEIERIKGQFDEKEAKRRAYYQTKTKFSEYFKEDPRLREINAQLDIISKNKELLDIPNWARIAIEYKNAAESTLYGADAEGGIRKIMSAMPSKEREYFAEFIKAKPEERKEILELVPQNERRFLQAAWGMRPDARPDLEEYFKNHYLPQAGWEGWSGTKDLADVKVRVVRNEGLDLSEFGFWRQDVEKSETNEAPGMPINKSTFKGEDLRRNLIEIMQGIGLEDVDVIVESSPNAGVQMDVHIDKDRRQEIIEFVNNNMDTLL